MNGLITCMYNKYYINMFINSQVERLRTSCVTDEMAGCVRRTQGKTSEPTCDSIGEA